MCPDVDVPFLGRILNLSRSELESKRRAMERVWNMFIGENSFENVLNELSLRRSSIDIVVVQKTPTSGQFRVYTGNADITITTQMSWIVHHNLKFCSTHGESCFSRNLSSFGSDTVKLGVRGVRARSAEF